MSVEGRDRRDADRPKSSEIGETSCAHMNPAAAFAFAMRGVLLHPPVQACEGWELRGTGFGVEPF